jgi:thymidylate kinase
MNRLIFIEGVSGVGKSTTAALMSKKLSGLGFSANCFLEGDASNPIDLYNAACLTQAEYDDLLHEHFENTREIAENSIHLSSCVLVRYADSERHFFASPYSDGRSDLGFLQQCLPIYDQHAFPLR